MDFTRLEDDELLQLTRDQPEAFGEFYERHARAVLSRLRREGLDLDDALDLTAEVFAAALQASRRYRSGEAPAQAWLFAIVRNKLARRRRKRAAEFVARRKLGIPRLEFSDEALERVEERIDAARAATASRIADLPPAEREAVLARVIEEREYEEIAAASAAAPSAVRQRVSRGLARLARLAKESHD